MDKNKVKDLKDIKQSLKDIQQTLKDIKLYLKNDVKNSPLETDISEGVGSESLSDSYDYCDSDTASCSDNDAIENLINNLDSAETPVIDEKQAHYNRCLHCSKLGLQYFNNETHGVKYELVSPGSSSGIFYRNWDCRYHTNFLAKPIGSLAKPELFFIELVDDRVTICSILDYDEYDLKAEDGMNCEYCSVAPSEHELGFYCRDGPKCKYCNPAPKPEDDEN